MIRVHDIPYGVSGVYVLCLQNDVLYVGGSGNIRTRILVHAHNIPFDQIWVEPLKERHEWKRRETELTRLLRPTHNRALPLGFHNDMRIRYMKPGFFKNEDLSALSPMHRLCFAGLWLMADKAGRLEDRPRRIKGELFPYDSVEVEPLLDDLTAGGFLLRYSVEGHAFIQIVNFVKHQRPHKDEPASKIPIPGPECVDSMHDHGDSTHLPYESRMEPGEVNGSSARRTENGELRTGNGELYKNVGAEPLTRSTPAVLLTFPVVGGDTKVWNLTQAHVDEWSARYPNLNILFQCNRALAWVKANPSKRKTSRGMEGFLVRWFGNAVDRRGGDDRRVVDDTPLSPPRLSKVSSAAIRAIEGAKRR